MATASSIPKRHRKRLRSRIIIAFALFGTALTALFAAVAKAEKTALVPFFLAGVADVPQADDLFQADRIHPKAEAHPRLLANVWPALRPLLK